MSIASGPPGFVPTLRLLDGPFPEDFETNAGTAVFLTLNSVPFFDLMIIERSITNLLQTSENI